MNSAQVYPAVAPAHPPNERIPQKVFQVTISFVSILLAIVDIVYVNSYFYIAFISVPVLMIILNLIAYIVETRQTQEQVQMLVQRQTEAKNETLPQV